MLFQWILFAGLALVAVASALGMLLSRNAIYSALNLIMNFATVAAFYMMLGAPFIALTQITVYAGAIMVLFLFVIMLLGAERLGGRDTMPWQRPLGIVLGIILLFELGTILLTQSGGFALAGSRAVAFGTPKAIGEMLFSSYLLPFEIISILLLVAMLGAIVLNRRRGHPL
jgi:NADH-quinone oxidoreductase subunit J